MKKIAFVFLISLLVTSCEKEEKLPPNPEWLNTMISQLENSPLPGISIYAYKWKGDYYYHVSNPISSCMFCEVYDYSGDKPSWTDDEFTDFINNGKMIKAVWEKGF
jgi:hypothetical protein